VGTWHQGHILKGDVQGRYGIIRQSKYRGRSRETDIGGGKMAHGRDWTRILTSYLLCYE
jgi:hypothetical protein